ncbi:MAG: hypothetical protein KAU95_00950 [Candidatus Aenigmarchaeota archaeon]|nr:hypothetical protein [Candidatus Aenigmarchaeota archaeon]
MRDDLFFCEAKKGCRFLKKNEHIFKKVREEWEDYLETGKDKINKEKFEREYNFTNLFECYEKWRAGERDKGFQKSYYFAEELLKKYEIPSLSEKEINKFLKEEEINEPVWGGIFLSAIINKLYASEEIHLDSNNMGYHGCCNKNKKIVVEGDCGGSIGMNMYGGEIIVDGDCGDWVGGYMEGGKIKIYGDNFNPKEQISGYAEGGEIYHKDELVWKDGELI